MNLGAVLIIHKILLVPFILAVALPCKIPTTATKVSDGPRMGVDPEPDK